MSKIGILTFHRAYNYGAVLQAYALNKVLNDLGVDAEGIDYFPECFYRFYNLKPKTSWGHWGIRHYIKRISVLSVIKKRNESFEKFIKENFRLSTSFSQNQLLQLQQLSYDILITGSDQVWNTTCAEFDPIFFLDFPSAKNTKKYSYAASFNLIELPANKIDEYRKRLVDYQQYSVREESGRLILKQLLNVEASVNCDPTFLLSCENWSLLANKFDVSVWTNSKPYILVYYVKISRCLMEYARALSQSKKMQVICIPCNLSIEVLNKQKFSEYGFMTLPSATPYEFLSLFKNASYVLTNSFHGTAFSLIFHKMFYSIMDFDDGGKNLRSKQLLDSIHLSDRMLNSGTQIKEIDNNIDWINVDCIVNQERKKAIQYLKEICELNQNE